MTKKNTPFWERLVCGFLAAVGAVALVAQLWSGQIDNIGNIVVWLCGACGIWFFSQVAVAKPRPQRGIDTLPAPSTPVRQHMANHARVAAIKAYRCQTQATLAEAKAVVAHYWPTRSPSTGKTR